MKGTVTAVVAGTFMTAIALSGCELVWDITNRSALRSDVRTLLAKGGVNQEEITCHMVATTRDGVCLLKATSEQALQLAKTLSLQDITSNSDSAWRWKDIRCVSQIQRMEGSAVQVFATMKGRPEELRLESGRAFDYFILIRSSGNSDVCIGVSYSYG